VYELRALDYEHVLALLRRSLGDERGIAGAPRVDDDALEFLAARSAGDARTALSALELACETVGEGGTVSLRVAEDALQRSAILYDKGGDLHYDLISAWIKSTRGSDPDASLLYLAAMLEGGEDPRFIARRMVIFASEDIGNADPRALEVAVSTAHAVEHVGMPECALNLSQAAIYLALAPKSNASIKALGRAREWVREHGTPEPPAALRSAAYPGAKKLGRGLDYEYPHDRPEGVSEQELMPDEAIGERFLELSEHGEESDMRERLERIRRARGRDS
jgi:putative ATPase